MPNRGSIPRSVRRLAHHGWSADAIARVYGLRRAEVLALLSSPLPPPRLPRTPRPRAVRWPDWSPSNGPEYRPDARPLPELVAGLGDDDRAEARANVKEREVSLERIPGEWGPTTPPRPGVLDDDQVGRVHRLRAEGRTIAEVAEALAVSVSTVKRALRPGYRPAAGAPPAMPAAAPIAAEEAPPAHTWDPADDD